MITLRKRKALVLKNFRIPGRLALKLNELGVSVATVLREAGLPRDLFDETHVLVSTDELFALWRSIAAVSADPFIGLKLGVENKTERFHPMAISALSTQNFVTAVQHMARYKKLTAPEEILSKLTNEEFTVSFRWLLAMDAEPQVLADYCFAWMLTIARHGTGSPLKPLRVEYVHQRVNFRPLVKHFGCEVVTNAVRNEIVFRASDALAPFITRNTELLDMLTPQFEEQLQRLTEEDSFVELVRRTIQDRLTGRRPSIEAVAQALHVSSRTLQRRLQDSGSSYQRVLDDLGNSALELNETAYLLGFEDPNSFGRAFRMWEGMPPSDWREAHRGQANVLPN